MLERFTTQKQFTVGGRGEFFVSLKVQDNSGNYKFYLDFPEQKPIAVSQGRGDRWRVYFDDPADVRDFLNLVARIDIDKGRVVGCAEFAPWPFPPRVQKASEYSIIADKLEVDDPEGELHYVIAILRAMNDDWTIFGYNQ